MVMEFSMLLLAEIEIWVLDIGALNRVTSGSGNVGIGGQSLTAVTTGDRNVAIGRQSGMLMMLN